MQEERWRNAETMPGTLLEQIDCLCDRFEGQWKSDQRPRIETYLDEAPPPARPALFGQLLSLEVEYRRHAGESPTAEEYRSRFSEHAESIDKILSGATSGDALAETGQWTGPSAHGEGLPDLSVQSLPVERIGRYELQKILGKGAFGSVYLGHDTDLDRPVAIKFLDTGRLSSDAALEVVRREARILARLKHPAIVAVHDVGRDERGTCYMIMEYIAGRSLKEWTHRERFSLRQAAWGMATVAEAVYHAHTQGLVHRDLKPGNILIDKEGGFHVADFGLAVDEATQRWLAGEIGGTPNYMAPEQVRGETHRLDGRTDVWGIGVVLYELLTLRLPFRSQDRANLFEQIRDAKPKPVREIDRTIPEELERICLKCLAKRMSDRYTSAEELAADLRHWHDAQRPASLSGAQSTRIPAATPRTGSPAALTATAPTKVVPRGLRSFSSEDQDFFLDLLAGRRDREGLPESLRFWKSRIEDPEAVFSCALIYGPSGCGKSSFVKAGLLPRLAEHVIPVYVEAVPGGTEARLLKELRKQCPQLTDELNLVQSIASLRDGRIAWPDRKVLIVIDQFEQWLHAHRAEDSALLVHALRQCDGGRLQCILMVRDDFWLATTRFLQALEVQLIEGKNVALVDLFDPRHAKKVLTDFGRALGCLPDYPGELGAEQEAFLDQAVSGLIQDGQVIPVRLSLFAEMVKTKPWVSATLENVGGTEGLGVAFLEESFGSRTANPAHRLHQEAARAVLKSLLPDHAANIKGRIRSHDELLEVSGYTNRGDDFNTLLRILDTDLRMITPTDPQSHSAAEGEGREASAGQQHYQLTHDYLVHSLREWLTRKAKETWRGRARLCLEERTAQWKSTAESRFLPSPAEYVRIGLGVPRKKQNADERAVMKTATKRYGIMALLLTVAGTVLGWVTWDANGRIQARRLSQAILASAPAELDELIDEELIAYRRWANPLLQNVARDESSEPSERLRAALAVVGVDRSQVDFLQQRLLDCPLDIFPPLRDRLAPHEKELSPELWKTLRSTKAESDARFRAGMALATFAPQRPQWSSAEVHYLAECLVKSNPDYQRDLRGHLRPLRKRLIASLRSIYDQYRDDVQGGTIRTAAAMALADFAADRPQLLAEIAAETMPGEYEIVYSALPQRAGAGPAAKKTLAKYSRTSLDKDASAKDRIRRSTRHAGAVVTSIRLGMLKDAVDGLRYPENGEHVAQFVHDVKMRGVRPAELARCLERAEDVTSRRALVLALGEYTPGELSSADRTDLIRTLANSYRHDPDSAIHGACGWLLRHWGFTEEVDRVDRTAIAPDRSGKRTWFVEKVDEEYMTFVVFRGDRFMMGAAESEEGWQLDETLHSVQIPRPFAVCDREVSRAQFEKFLRETGNRLFDIIEHAPTLRHPAASVRWNDAVMFCRWLSERAAGDETDQCYNDSKEWKPIARGIFTDIDFHPERGGFRLPTEAEWEFACRGGTKTPYSFATDRKLLSQYAWFKDNSNRRIHLSAMLKPNPRGLFDMHGNVQEWCYDKYASYADDDPPNTSNRVLRGGGWPDDAGICRSGGRASDLPNVTRPRIGLRVVKTLVEEVDDSE